MVQLTALPASLLDHIGSLLVSQQDRVALALTSRAFETVYPKQLTHVFRQDATLDEYLNFFHAVIRRHIRTIEVAVDPDKWNQLQHLWEGLTFDLVAVYPNDLTNMDRVIDMPVATEVRSGFLTGGIIDVMHPSDHMLSLRVYSTTPFPLPWFHPHTPLTMLDLMGNFTHLERIPSSITSLNTRYQRYTLEELHTVATQVDTLGLEWCTFDQSCVNYIFDGSSLTLGIRDLELINTVSRVDKIEVYAYAALPEVHVLHGVRAEVTVSGIADATLEEVMNYFKMCFPTARSIRFDQVSVTEV
jgi:hypothetical protein